MTLKSILKASSIVIGIILFSLVFFLIPKYNGQKYLPNQQREIKVKIADNNIEARIYIYLEDKHKEDFEITLYDDQLKENLTPYIEGRDKFASKEKFHYVYIVEKGKTYTVKIKNKTDSIITSIVIVEDNN
jgi:PHD/YefM family antitoxin component YafN of YafNO toxin-antitoxin module